jgi:hypothetical protein
MHAAFAVANNPKCRAHHAIACMNMHQRGRPTFGRIARGSGDAGGRTDQDI